VSPGPLGLIIDLDNTLYRAKSPDGTFAQSELKWAIMRNARRFVAQRLGVSPEQADELLAQAKARGSLSLVFEQCHGISRYEWFANVWNLEPAQYITPADRTLSRQLRPYTGRALVLTSGPRVWALPALSYLGIADVFGDRVITGEPDIRKPNPAVFLMAAQQLGRAPNEIVSIGDQNITDIIPAKALGMRTILIGPTQGDAHFHAHTIHQALKRVGELER